MPLDQVKTQVLLLHREQTTLDNLSAGFPDRYTVHCATSGTEALNTLGEVPIHVIVCAQDLPGMSGVEALREAKRRSPETIGILLAGKDDRGLEALVGEKEIFQVVRGGITAEDLGRLVDNATRQMRLMALAESANDTAADPDSTSEHIVMETSENGSTIISDGTGRLPILDPQKVSASTSVGAQGVDVLVLTKDEEFLATVKESTRGLHNVHYANTLKQAEEAVRAKKAGVAVIDAGMVGENVEKLSQHLRGLQPRLVAIVAGRRDDGEMLMDLINRGKVYRFLLKPVSPGRARLAIEASVKHHLEAPDAAFKAAAKSAAAAPKPAAKPAPKPAPGPSADDKAAKPRGASKPAAAADPKPAPKAKTRPKQPPGDGEAAAKVEPTIGPSPVQDGLSDAFDGDDSSFTETMTGIVTSVGKSISGMRGRVGGGESAAPDKPVAADSGGGDVGASLKPKLIGAGAIVLIAAAGIGYWLFSGDPAGTLEVDAGRPAGSQPGGATAESPSDASADAVPVPETPARQAASAADLLEEARLAREAGQVFNPAGSNAIELYLDARRAAPGDTTIEDELRATIDEALAMAESALLERRVGDAAAALERVALAQPDHPRLPFLNAQVRDLQLRAALDEARIAIRDSRFEDAAAAIGRARAVPGASVGEIDVVAGELRSARSEQQVGEVLALANQRLDQGSLIAPANDNARYYYELVLSSEPGNAAARQGLVAIADKLVLQARAEIDDGNFATAEAILADAERIDPDSAELDATTRALAEARRDAAQQRAAAEAAAESARQAAAEREAERLRAEREAEAERQARADREAAAASEMGPDPALAAETGPPVEAAGPAPAPEDELIGLSELERTRYVAPSYPRSAERRGVSGWVDVVFTVTTEGSVGSVEIIDSDPDDTFVKSATKAVEKWEFEPVVENGVAVEKRVGVRLMFAIE